MSEEVIAFTPNRQVLTFNSLQRAKVILLKENHRYIVENATDLAHRFSEGQLLEMWRVTLGHDGKHAVDQLPPAVTRDKVSLALYLWPLLVSKGKLTADMAYLKPEKAAVVGQVLYYCPFRPGKSDAQDLVYYNLARQARVLVDMFMEKIPVEGLPEHRFYKEVMNLKEALNTRQDPWVVFNFYRRKFIDGHFLRIVEDGRIRGTKVHKFGARKGEVR